MTTAINDHLQTVKVDVFDADGALLNEGWGDVTKTTLTESVPGGDLMVMDFEIVDGDSVQENLSFVLRTGSASANVIGASYELRVFLFPLTSWQGGTTCSCTGPTAACWCAVWKSWPQYEHPVPPDGPERYRHWLRHDECVHCHWNTDPFRRLLSSGVWH